MQWSHLLPRSGREALSCIRITTTVGSGEGRQHGKEGWGSMVGMVTGITASWVSVPLSPLYRLQTTRPARHATSTEPSLGMFGQWLGRHVAVVAPPPLGLPSHSSVTHVTL